jgi:hypothetical protein
MTDRLSIYNNALLQLGERKLASLTENRKPRRVLDQVWDSDFIRGCLEDGHWNFGTRTIRSDYNPSISPDFGYKYAHDKPDDWVRTSALSISEYVTDPLTSYNDEVNFWFCDHPVIFVRYVSDDPSYGGDMSSWPESFVDYVETKLAAKICLSITQSSVKENDLLSKANDMLKVVKGRDAQNDPPKFTPTGSWVRSRAGSRGRGRWGDTGR